MKKFWQLPVVWGVIGVLVTGLLVAGLLVIFRPRVPIPDRIVHQLNFSLMYPDASSGYEVDPSKTSYDASSKVLIFHAKQEGVELIITEQATPDPFNDIPQYYPKLIEKLNGYKDFDSINGSVSLTRPTELKGGQTAVFNGKGTLIFVKPSRALSDDDWRAFFNSLVIARH